TPKVLERDAVFGAERTDSTRTQTVAQFDPSLGTLTGVEIVNESTLSSTVSVESMDPSASHLKVLLGGDTSVSAPGVNAAAQVSVGGDEQADVAAFDGQFDFAGPSAKAFTPRDMTGSKSVLLSAADHDLSAFVGTGTVSLSLTADARSSVSGSGNLAALVNTT